MDMINEALRLATISIIALGGGITVTQQPYLTFNTATQLFALNAENQYYPALAGGPRIYFNTNVYQLFGNMEPEFNGYTGNLNFLMPIKSNFNNAITTTIGAGLPGFTMIQEYSTGSGWRNIESIVFVSNLPVLSEYIPPPTGSSNNDILPIITDFLITKSSLQDDVFEYVPTAQYRYADLQGIKPIRLVNIYAYYKLYTGQYLPVYIAPNKNVSMKIAFTKKAQYNE